MTTPLLQYRLKKQWSCANMADALTRALSEMAPAIQHRAVSRSLVSKWERGLMAPSISHALAIRAVCGRSVPLSSLVVWR